MFYRNRAIAAAMLSLATLAPASFASAADLPLKAVKPVADVPFFFVIDDRVTYSYIFNASQPGQYTVNPNGTVATNHETKQVYSFTHFDAWAYGTNFFNISLFKSSHNDPSNPCIGGGTTFVAASTFTPASCAGASEIYGLLRSTYGFNEIFNTKAFTVGPLHNVSFVIGGDANVDNRYIDVAKRDFVGGLQFAFDLPYKGFFNVNTLAYKEINHNAFAQCGGEFAVGNVPGVSCLADGNTNYKTTWAIETNYYMDLGFLPENMQYFSISGRAAWYGKKGNDNQPCGSGPVPDGCGGAPSAVEFNGEPIRLTMDASKAIWGPKYSHFVDVWVAYRYWQNKFGLDHANSPTCLTATGLQNGTCTESSLYSGVTVKF
jgi:hypothetical protein